LTEFMRENVPVEVKSELQRRERVLGQLRAIFVDWVKKVCLAKGLPEELASEAGGQLYTSGSYRLGVHEPGADIDTVCVAPQHCTREDFFASLRATLEAHPQVTGLTGIDTAAVPIMTFDFERVNIDLLFAALPLNAVPPTLDIDDDFVLQGVDTATEKSLNGPRVTNLIVALVPAFDAFLPVLRCVRRWAKARGLYGNKLGYLGGVNWCILVALVCQLYPKGTPAYLLNRFFRVLAQWQWPNPIHLCPPAQNSTLGYEVWDPRAQYNRYHLMPIITPAYPAMNSSVSVNQWTLEVMREEFNRGHELAQKAAAAGSSGEVGGERWAELFEPTDFFCRYPHYLALNVVARDEPGQRAWGGFVESRLRKLLDHLGRALPLRRLHLCPLKFKRCTIPLEETLPATEAQKDTGDEGKTGDGDEEKTTVIERQGFSYFIAFELDNKRLEGQTISIDGPVQTFKQYELARYNAFEEGMDLVVQHSQWKQLPEWVFESLGGKAQAKLVHKSYVRQRKEKERSERAAAQEKARAAQEAAARAAAQAQGVEDVEEGKEEDMEPSGKRKYEEFADGSVHPNQKAAELKRSKKLEDGSAEQGEQIAVIPLVEPEEDVVQGDLAKDIGQVSTVGLEEEKDKPTTEVPQAGRVEDGKAIFSTDEVAHPNLRVSLKELPPFTDPPDLFQLGYALNKSQKSSTSLSQERQFTEPFQVVFKLLPRR